MTRQRMLTGFSPPEIKQKIDTFLAEKTPYQPVDLVLPVSGSAFRFEYRGINVREWHCAGNVRFDAVVEIFD